MAKDKFTAVWVSHSSMGEYLKCPRAYYLKNMYKDPKTRHKVALMSAPLALGQAVHEVVESLSVLPVSERFNGTLEGKLELAWEKVAGRKGGFKDEAQEKDAKERALNMLRRIEKNPGPLLNKAIKVRQELPYFWLSEEDNIILCGKIDWLEYVEETDSVNVLDFKTGKHDEDPDSLQLPIYLLLAQNCQTRPVSGAYYWYLDRDDAPKKVVLPEAEDARKRVLTVAKKVALARKLNHFQCPQVNGCRQCEGLEQVVAGKAEFVGVNNFGQDVYVLPLN